MQDWENETKDMSHHMENAQNEINDLQQEKEGLE